MTIVARLAREVATEIQLDIADGSLDNTGLVTAVEDAIRKTIEACAEIADKYTGDPTLGIPIYGVGPNFIATRIRALLTDKETQCPVTSY